MLKALACRRVGMRSFAVHGRYFLLLLTASTGDIPDNVSVHYGESYAAAALSRYITSVVLDVVSQEVQLTEASREQTPLQCVLDADVERRLLLEEASRLEAMDSLDGKQQRLVPVASAL